MKAEYNIRVADATFRPTVFIRHRFQHMGAHSGYDLLVPPLLAALQDNHSVFLNETRPPDWARRILARLCHRVYASPFYGVANLWAELRALAWRPMRGKVVHVLYAEDNLGLLARFQGHPGTRVVATIHQPYHWWMQHGLDPAKLLNGIDAVIVLSQSEARAFGAATRTPVHFVPHGIDVDFFSPAASAVPWPDGGGSPRCLFVGNWLRDFRTLHDVVDRLGRSDLGFRFDVVTPEKADRSVDDAAMLRALVARPDVLWHRGIDDERLRGLYRDARVLLMPLRESTANNAVLEAMACGVPIVTNLTSGISDYTAPDCSVVVAAGDADAMAAAVMRIVLNPELRQSMAAAARQRAVADYAWSCVAARVKVIYADLG